ncbi:hypothetical protein AMTRI_Chr06g194460 [Amborella trichopoda]
MSACNFHYLKLSVEIIVHLRVYAHVLAIQVKLREMKPGILSQKRKEALGMPEGAPPPWLIKMQRYGPPPSYPHLKIPSSNAPIPPGASFAYHPGGWGKPPVVEEEPVDRSTHWGELEEEEEEEQMEEEEMDAGIQSVDSLSSTLTGVETPDVIDLRKQQRKEPEKPLYQVLEEERIAFRNLTQNTYVELLQGQKSDKVDVTLRPEELEALDDVTLAANKPREEEKPRNQLEDFSDMVAKVCSVCILEWGRENEEVQDEGKAKKKNFKF